ncbi:MAG: sulfur carrier protein ThiS [Cytophagaceae bacterium]
MEIYINNQLKQITNSDCNLLQLVNDINLAQSKGIAIAVNNVVVPKANWSSHKIKEQDKVVIIKATQGG